MILVDVVNINIAARSLLYIVIFAKHDIPGRVLLANTTVNTVAPVPRAINDVTNKYRKARQASNVEVDAAGIYTTVRAARGVSRVNRKATKPGTITARGRER